MCNNYPTLEEIKNIIDGINERLGEEAWDEGIGLSVHSCFGVISVKLWSFTLWDNEEDPRDYMLDKEGEETEEREDLQGYLERKTLRIASLILRVNGATR